MAGFQGLFRRDADPATREGRQAALLGGLAGTLSAILFFQWLLDPAPQPAPAAQKETAQAVLADPQLPPLSAPLETLRQEESPRAEPGEAIQAEIPSLSPPLAGPQKAELARIEPKETERNPKPANLTARAVQGLTAHAVQVGAFFSEQEAQKGWRNVLGSAGDLLDDLPRETVEADTGTAKGKVYRLRVGPFTQVAQAQSLCADLKARGLACFLAKPIAQGPKARIIANEDNREAQTAIASAAPSLAIDPVLGTLRRKPYEPEQLTFVINGDRLASLARPAAIEAEPLIEPASDWGEATQAVKTESPVTTAKAKEPLVQARPTTVASSTPPPRRPSRSSQSVSPIDREASRSRAVKSGLLYRGKPQQKNLAGVQYAQAYGSDEDGSRLSSEPKPFLGEGDIPDRAPLLLELGNPFLETGELDSGFELPTGAVWQPRLWVFGTLRSAVQVIDNGDSDRVSEWANRFDLFANLQLTGTEKAVLGIRPFDSNRPDQFSGYRFERTGNDNAGFREDFNADIRTAFIEGDFGSLFPNLDPQGTSLLDFGFTVGRQPIIFQDGILISDTLDAAGLVRNNIRLPGVSNLRLSALYGSNIFDETTRTSGGVGTVDDDNLQLAGLFTSWDTPISTFNVDGAYVWDDSQADGDGIYGGISAAQRFGPINTTFRALGSYAHGDETTLVRDGLLLTGEMSWTPTGTNDTLYVNPFVTYGEYVQAARERVDGGGPLAALGILFASPNIGRFGSEISNRANDVAGAAIGYQAFWDDNRRNLAFEIAVRKELGLKRSADTSNSTDQYAAGLQFQQAIGQRLLLQLESFYAYQRDQDNAYGGRAELLYQF